ncbi:MAG: PEP-CTERM system TPR-repeat protein PrsT [Rhodanobacter sp.]|nr:MAG: PEP-CTERM system TPR-repeat protein PrsT [Rhodanobacter sp.]TAM01055.1 MAG: PEP-CTERM system TPR-repeat protein PrsT [Rhodanobacter sp.]TAM40879.1 MAG: PEP-CTERM system TPR-repeat protein PrsT [Rhodanobacter sp.]TAN25721.1 MAG: PEP-CTERM system TPR-repeat protein PrsT [Rhodanobacter sp.]
MRLTKLNTGAIRHFWVLLCAILLLSACGLAKGKGDLDAGAKYQASGQYRAAYIEAKKVLQRDSKNGNAWLLLGRASLMLGDPKDALNSLQKAQANGVPEARWAVPMGRTLLLTRQYDTLLKTVTSEQSLEPQVKARVQALRGDAYRELRQFDQAQQSYKAALALDSRSPHALVGLARLAVIAKDPVSAGKYLQQALAAAPENPQAWIAKGDLAFNSHDFSGAESAYQKVLDFKHPDWVPQEHFYALTRLASAQLQQNQSDKALASIQTLEKMSPQQPYPHYLHAVLLYKQGHFDDATAQLQQVLKASPNNPQAQMLLGAVNYAQGNYGQAEMYLSNVMGTDPNVEARKLLALTFYREGRSRQALDMLRPAVPGTPSDTELLAQMQRAAAEGSGTPGAVASAASAGKARPGAPATGKGNPADAQFAPAAKALVSGNTAEAIRLLQAIPAGDAATEARRAPLLAMAYVRGKRPDEAVKIAAEYARKNPQNSAAHLLYGTTLVAAGKRAEARAQYSEAYKLDPKNIGALLSLGSLDSLEDHYRNAAGRYATVLKQEPQNAVAMTALGRLAMLQNDKAQAVKWLKQAISAAPKSAPAYVGLVLLYSESGQFEEAANTARQFAEAAPNNPAALNALGAADLNAGHHHEALKPLQQAVKLAPQVALFRTNLARAQILNKDTKAAEDNLDQVIKADPAQLTAVTLRAFMKLQNHDLPGAISLAQTLQKQPMTKAAGFSLEGDLYMTNKSWGKAAQAYQQALKINSVRPLVVKSFMALSESGAKQPDGVLRDWLAKHPDDASTRLLLAQYYTEHVQNASAATQYEQVLKAFPSNVGALNNLAWIYAEQHNPKALSLAQRAHKLAPDSPGVADTYAWALIADNQPKTALSILLKAAKAAPKMPTIQYHLAVAQARTGDKAGARTTLEALQKSGVDFKDKQAAEKLGQELGGAGK